MVELLYKDLSYQLQGVAIEVRKQYGSGHKEIFYQRAFVDELNFRKISFDKERSIPIYSCRTGKILCSYRPDLIVDNKIIVEIKALDFLPQRLVDQLYDYLRNSKYELGYFINFGGEKILIKRIIYTNDRKFKGAVRGD